MLKRNAALSLENRLTVKNTERLKKPRDKSQGYYEELRARLEHHVESFSVSVLLEPLILAFFKQESDLSASYADGEATSTFHNGAYKITLRIEDRSQIYMYPSVIDSSLFLIPEEYSKSNQKLKLILTKSQEEKASSEIKDCCAVFSISKLTQLANDGQQGNYVVRIRYGQDREKQLTGAEYLRFKYLK